MGDDNPKGRLSQGCTRRGGVLNRLSSGSTNVAVPAEEVTFPWLLLRHFYRYHATTFGIQKVERNFPSGTSPSKLYGAGELDEERHTHVWCLVKGAEFRNRENR